MYETSKISERIKARAKEVGTSLKSMLELAGVNWNFMSSTLKAGSMPKADNLAKIADQLDCSVDYLLGRTDNPEVNR